MSRFKSTLLRAGLLASLLSFGTGAAFAEAPNADIRTGMQTPPPVDQRVALVIGNSAYQHTVPLPNPRNDAGDIALALKRVGFAVIEGYDLDKRGMDDAFRR
ncbi:MAG TPA: caspase family protein, partial [Burkholderiales bacterium]|nr:caspase family protein [Burkholderiales bacterium]